LGRDTARNALIPGELVHGWPYVGIMNQRLCLNVPFYKRERRENGFYMYPISRVITYTYPTANTVRFQDLRYLKEYKAVDFSKPIEVFKHEAVKDFTAAEYREHVAALYAKYDELLESLMEDKDFTGEDEMRRLFRILMEPRMYPCYLALSRNFFADYCGAELV
jgi:hypothetical protein